ncbi:MAG: hypothetical protein ACKV2T_39960 [Kofleriaceae bacterium]
MSGRSQGPTWRKAAYRAAIDLAEGRVTFDPDMFVTSEAFLALMEQNPGAMHVVGGQPELDDDCVICRAMRERYGAPEVKPLPDGSTIEIYGPSQRRSGG